MSKEKCEWDYSTEGEMHCRGLAVFYRGLQSVRGSKAGVAVSKVKMWWRCCSEKACDCDSSSNGIEKKYL